MSRSLVGLFLVLAAAQLTAQSARIQDVGIHGHYQLGTPTSVRVELANPTPQAVLMELQFSIDSGRQGPAPDVFSQSILMPPKSQRLLDVPIAIRNYYYRDGPVLDFQARDAAGVLAHDKRDLKGSTSNGLVLILCLDDQLCRQAEELLTISGNTDERAGKTSSYTFLPSRDPLPDWWAYGAANRIVLALPPAQLSSEQQLALEGYLRQGGILILPESVTRKSSFLAAYRHGAPSGIAQAVGLGSLYRYAGLNTQLASLFNPDSQSSPSSQMVTNYYYGTPDAMSYARSRLALSFHFPGFAWLLWWLAAYILVVGLLNFSLLSHYDRREWGWITVPVISILFSIAFYISVSASRPKKLQFDEIAIYRLDDASGLAATSIGLRISSPSRTDLTLNVPGDLLWDGQQYAPRDDFDRGLSIRDLDSVAGWNVNFGPPQQIPFQLQQWSFADFNFRCLHQFPGTIRLSDASHLVNETGQSFQKAVYFNKDGLYTFDSLPAGATINLATAPHEPLSRRELARRWLTYNSDSHPPPQLFSLEELLNSAHRASANDSSEHSEFVGLSDDPVPQTGLPGHSFIHKNYAITIVSIGEAP